MKRTRLCAGTALLLVCVSIALMLHRQAVLGEAIHGPSGTSSWRVTFTVQGEAADPKATVTIAVPAEVRQQHVVEEHFPPETSLEHRRGAISERREITWRRETSTAAQFRLTYSCRCVLGMRHPTAQMKSYTHELDAAPAEGEHLRPSDLVECFHDEITQTAKEQVVDGKPPLDQVQMLYRFVGSMETQPTPGTQSAVDCLRDGGGNSAGKSRLLAALCRNRGIPARVLTGLILVGSQDQTVHHWVEAWVNGQWLPMCPTSHHFGPRQFPHNHLILSVGDNEWIRGQQARFATGISVEDLHATEADGEDQLSTLKMFWLRLSPYSLGPKEQSLVKFLLLLPLATLIVCLFRIVIGLQTYGTFGPAILALAFLDLEALPWGIGVFVGIVLVGWGLRRVLDSYRLLLVPRTATLLTMIVIVLLVTVLTLSQHGIYLTRYIALFPMIILTHMVERFWTNEAEDGTASAFKTLVGTMLVTVTISVTLASHWVASLMFRFPELLGVVLAAQILLGRYTGYRLSELYRFRDLLRPPRSSRSSLTA
jgi:hypothetical protein